MALTKGSAWSDGSIPAAGLPSLAWVPASRPGRRPADPRAVTRRGGLLARLVIGLLALAVTASRADPAPPAPERVVFATNWKAEASHGGFYQALADGTYRAYGLAVEIRPGGAQVNNRPLLPAGRIDFLLTGNLLQSFDNVKNGVPTRAVAALFQKEPQALIAHPGQGYESFEALKTAPVILIAKDAQFTWWQWLKAAHGFRDEQLRPYNYALAPFLANPRAIQQGYAVAEPIFVAREAGFQPVVHLLADHGFSTYSTMIEVREETLRTRPDLVQRFVDASIIGWTNYLYGDHQAGNALILKDNPETSAADLEASLALLKSQGIVDSGASLTQGIGVMTAERIRAFYEAMVTAGLYRAGDVDLTQVADTRFVGKGVGLDLKARLLAPAGAGH